MSRHVIRLMGSTVLVVTAAVGCQSPPREIAPQIPSLPWTAAAVAHAGVGSPPENSDGCRRAVDAALAVLEAGGDPLDAVVAGVVQLEDDPRFNAGTGSRVRIDGETVQMDASIMDSSGRFAAIAAIERVRNPIQVARALLDTPHLMLAGDGATRFARTLGMQDWDPATPATRELARRVQESLRTHAADLPLRWQTFDWRQRWNFQRTLEEAGLDVGHDTVGVAVRAADGRFAVALSTGGTSITLRGRVGDVPIHGAGLYAGAAGASAATGEGERIIEAALAREVHRWLAEGATAQSAAERAVTAVKASDPEAAIGLVVIDARGLAMAADRPMAWAGRELGSTVWQGPALDDR